MIELSETWIPVGLAAGLGSGRVMRATVGQTDMVVWRTASGHLHAWNNRCPHRGMRLSFGFVRGDRLACIYHGWQYGEDTVCRFIPAHPDLTPPQTITASSYPVLEHLGLIWVSENPAEIPTDLTDSYPLRSMTIDAGKDAILTALKATKISLLKTGARETAQFEYEQAGPHLAALTGSISGTDLSLMIGIQERSAEQTTLHVALNEERPASHRITLSRWLEALRRALEADAMMERKSA